MAVIQREYPSRSSKNVINDSFTKALNSGLICFSVSIVMGDVVRYVPGVGISQGEGNRDAVIFHGNNSTGDFYVNGLRDDVQYFRDLYNIDRVEVLKGSNGMMFGRGGAGGVINRVSPQQDCGELQV